MSEVAWETEYSLDSRASPESAWAYMTNVANWDDPPATFELEGPFEVGSRGTTRMPGQEPRHWQLAAVTQGESYVIEMALDGATLAFEWRFRRIDVGTRLTQHIVLNGENAAAYVSEVAAAFESSLAAGMRRTVAAIERTEARGGDLA